MDASMSESQNQSSSPDSLLQTINLPVIESAGGLVCNHHNHILLMFKRGRWDMPKGRVDEDGKKLSAIREVNEETGLESSKLSIEGKLVSTWHTTRHQNIRYMKKTHWYLMRYDGFDADTIPQVEEGIIECRWIHLSELPKYRGLMRARIEYVVDFWHENLAYTARP
jgi:8-oxo-dGTP pyrophosphatase MutT (NUDIX family)